MRLYRLHRLSESESSAGYQFFASKREAQSAAADWRRNKPGPDDDHITEIDEIDVVPTKAGILRALNRYAKHNDNG